MWQFDPICVSLIADVEKIVSGFSTVFIRQPVYISQIKSLAPIADLKESLKCGNIPIFHDDFSPSRISNNSVYC